MRLSLGQFLIALVWWACVPNFMLLSQFALSWWYYMLRAWLIQMCSKKLKPKCINDDVWKRFFHKLAILHLATWLRINSFTCNFQGFYVNEHLRMSTSRFGINCLKSTCEIVFCCICWVKFCNLYIKQAFSRGAL